MLTLISHNIDFGGTNRDVFVNQPNQLGLLFEPNGTIQFFDNGAQIANLTDSQIGSAPLGINITVAGGNVSLFVNGTQENISGTTGHGNSYSAPLSTDNYITLGQYQDPSSSDVNPTFFTVCRLRI